MNETSNGDSPGTITAECQDPTCTFTAEGGFEAEMNDVKAEHEEETGHTVRLEPENDDVL